MNKVSIALCTYNGANFLPEQLRSFLRQTRPPDELIVCDDRSSDATVKIIEKFAEAAPFFVALHVNEENLGSTKNFEKAIALCTGELIFLSDQDDVWFPKKLEKFSVEFEKSEKIGMIFSNAELVGENLEPLRHDLWAFSFTPEERRKAKNGKMFEVLLKSNVVTGATMAFRSVFRGLFLPIPTDIPNTIHDAWIALIIAANAEVGFIEEPSIAYRQHANQQLGIDWKYKEKIKAMRRQEKYTKSIGFQRKNRERLIKLAEIIKSYPQFRMKSEELSIDELTRSFMEEGNQMIQHYEARKNLPREKLKRISPIIKELSTGRYNRFSKGFISPVKDLFENW
jgi:glycosyltransferase involved in cell wall biosynthesis